MSGNNMQKQLITDCIACHVIISIVELTVPYTGCAHKNNPFAKIHYLSYCNRFFHQIHGFHRGGLRPRKQQISLQYLLWFKNYNHLNLKLHFSK